jgi:hypothetical protein
MTIGTSTPATTLSPTTQFIGPDVEISNDAGVVGFYDATPVAQQTIAAAATDASTTQALANSIRTILINLGLASA